MPKVAKEAFPLRFRGFYFNFAVFISPIIAAGYKKGAEKVREIGKIWYIFCTVGIRLDVLD